MLYSASQLIGKTIILEKDCNVYRVTDVNVYGDKAAPLFVTQSGNAFVVDSFLAATEGYINTYGIAYAKRLTPYFTFFDLSGNYLAVAVIGDSRFSLKALRDQGTLSVKEEVEKEARDNRSDLSNFFNDIKKPAAFLIVAILAAMLIKNLRGNKTKN